MGIFILFSCIFLIAGIPTIWALVCGIKVHNRCKENLKKQGYSYYYSDSEKEKEIGYCCNKFEKLGYCFYCNIWSLVTFILTIIAFIAIFCCSVIVLITQTKKEVDYQKFYYEYQLLSQRLEEDRDNYLLFYNDIIEYNNEVIQNQYWVANPWVNWYHNDLMKDLPVLGEPTE